MREVHVLRQLNHPNIVRLCDVVEMVRPSAAMEAPILNLPHPSPHAHAFFAATQPHAHALPLLPASLAQPHSVLSRAAPCTRSSLS
jgi:hypothetical protein